MATTTDITTTYAGEFSREYIAAALLSGATLNNGGITIKPNVKYKEVIKKVATDSNVIKDGSCDFTDTATVTLTERILQPEEFQVNLELCKKDFRSDWEAVQMGMSTFDSLPPAFADFLVAHVAGLVAESTENNIWKGVNANAGEFDGFVTKMTADAAVIDVTGTTVTAANVIDEMGKNSRCYPFCTLWEKRIFTYMFLKNVARAYVRALGGFAAAGLGANGVNAEGTQWWNNGALSFDGVKIFVANGLADKLYGSC